MVIGMSETKDETPLTELLPRHITLDYIEYLAFAHRTVSWAEAYYRLHSGISPVGTTIDVSPFDPETEARLKN